MESCGPVSVDHKRILPTYQGHSSPDCPSFSSVLRVLDYNQIQSQLLSLFDSNGCGLILAAIVDDDDLMLDFFRDEKGSHV